MAATLVKSINGCRADNITAVGVIQRGFQQDKLVTAIMVGFLVNAPIAITLAANGAGA